VEEEGEIGVDSLICLPCRKRRGKGRGFFILARSTKGKGEEGGTYGVEPRALFTCAKAVAGKKEGGRRNRGKFRVWWRAPSAPGREKKGERLLGFRRTGVQGERRGVGGAEDVLDSDVGGTGEKRRRAFSNPRNEKKKEKVKGKYSPHVTM